MLGRLRHGCREKLFHSELFTRFDTLANRFADLPVFVLFIESLRGWCCSRLRWRGGVGVIGVRRVDIPYYVVVVSSANIQDKDSREIQALIESYQPRDISRGIVMLIYRDFNLVLTGHS